MEIGDTKKEDDLLNAIRNGVTEANTVIEDIGNGLVECARLLRVEQSERSSAALSEGVKNLNHLVDFIKELKRGIGHLKGFNVPPDIFSCWDKSVGLFNEMFSAIEGKDWITLADLIEYELHPLLAEGKKGLSELHERLTG
jgi:hypothetical protein